MLVLRQCNQSISNSVNVYFFAVRRLEPATRRRQSARAGGMVKRTRARATANIDGLSADEIVSRYARLPRSVSGRLECRRTIKHSVSDCAVEDA